MDLPETQYTTTVDGVSIAYQVLGSGLPLIVFAASAWASNVEIAWEWSVQGSFYRALASRGTLVVFDRRGTGLSDKVSGDRLPTLDAKMDDIRAVVDAAGFDRAVLFGLEDGAAPCLLFAATYPERTQALIMTGATASGLQSPDRPWAWIDEQWDEEIKRCDLWGTRAYTEGNVQTIFPSHINDEEFVYQYGRVMRHSMSHADVVAACRI
jgi:pimeloyl-ACP methyl ester carboxylesterase